MNHHPHAHTTTALRLITYESASLGGPAEQALGGELNGPGPRPVWSRRYHTGVGPNPGQSGRAPMGAPSEPARLKAPGGAARVHTAPRAQCSTPFDALTARRTTRAS